MRSNKFEDFSCEFEFVELAESPSDVLGTTLRWTARRVANNQYALMLEGSVSSWHSNETNLRKAMREMGDLRKWRKVK